MGIPMGDLLGVTMAVMHVHDVAGQRFWQYVNSKGNRP